MTGVVSKDFSSFTSNQTKIEAGIAKNENSNRTRIVALVTSTEDHLNTANSVIQNATVVGETFKITKQVVSTLLAPAKDLVDLLSALSDIHPAIQVVAGVVKAIIKLEMDRQENDRQIAVLYNSMSNMLIVLAYLDDIFMREDGLRQLLEKKLGDIVELVNEFGNFCDVYYKHRSIVRFLRSAKYKEMLAGFAQNFVDMKGELENLVSQRTAMTVHKTADTVDSVAADVSQLVKFMEIHTSREREAEALVQTKGGLDVVLKDDKILEEVAQKLGDQINSTVRYALHQDLAQQLKDNHVLFDIKMEAVKDQLTETVNRSSVKILMALDAGPHELIHDADIQHIWKDMKWRNTVKCRNFVSAVHHHFEQLFIRHMHEHKAPHPDLWTLNYMSKVIFYPAIGDAIDEDSSGYVSLHELNHFFDSRPPEWTVPQWIAYWAAGWYRDNLRYREKIMTRLRFLEGAVETAHEENKEVLKDVIQAIKPGMERIVESIYKDTLDYFDDDTMENAKLDALRINFTEIITKEVEEQLAKSKYELDDKRILMLVIGNSRLESRLLCVMHRLLKRHHKVFDIGKDKPLQAGVAVAMQNTWEVVFGAFVGRMRALSESWRQQRMDIALQAQWYSNGLFEDWYLMEQEAPESEEEYDEDLSDYEAGTEQDEEDFVDYATRPPTAVETDDGHIDSTLKSPSDEHASHEDQSGSVYQESEGVYQGEQPLEHRNFGNDIEAARTSVELPGIESRMERLEQKVDDLKDLMLRILRQLENS